MSIVLICRFKDERHILYEWVHHHLAEGIDKIILIDDNSDDEFLKYNDWIDGYIKSDLIEVHQSQFGQQDDYNRFLILLREYTWVVQIDMDEFIFCSTEGESLKSILAKKYTNTDYIRINWKLFQHQSKLQAKSVIEDNTVTHYQNKDPSSPMGVKCVAKTKYLSNIRIHRCDFSHEVKSIHLDSHNDDIQINHYRTQSDEFLYGVKELRGGGVYKDSYKVENLNKKHSFKFTKQDYLLRNKRSELIMNCNSRSQIRPRIYPGSSWIREADALSDSIILYLRGRLGNQMFQFALANILAKSLGRQLYVGGRIGLSAAKSYPAAPDFEELDVSRCEILSQHMIFNQQLINAQKNKKAIILNGWFQRYQYYRQHKEEIIRLYRPSLFRDIQGGSEKDIVFHIRTTDYRRPRVNDNYMWPLSINYFRSIYQSRSWNKAYIVTDDREDELVLETRDLTNAEIISNSQLDDFNFIRNSKNIVLSTSTFSWWAAWLSDATIIYYPRTGIWNPMLKPDVDLKVLEKRYSLAHSDFLLKDYWLTQSSKQFPKVKQLKKYIQQSVSSKKIYSGKRPVFKD